MDVRRKRIYFILPSLSGGGAEKVMLTLLKHMDRSLFDPTLVLLSKEGKYVNQIPSEVKVLDLKAPQARYALFKLIKLFRKDKPDIVFSTLGHLNLLIALLKPFLPKTIQFVSRESNTVSIENKQEKYPRLFDFLYKHVYNRFDLIIAQAHYMKEDLVKNFAIDPMKIQVVYNPVDAEGITQKLLAAEPEKRTSKQKLLAAGRLSHQKGFDLLIETMALLKENVVLDILGDGEEREKLQKQIMTLGLDERVKLYAFQENPYQFMQTSDLFVLSSRYEGLPNVVIEAGVCGLPIVAMDTPGGTKELIAEDQTGVLVSEFTPVALAKAIEKALKVEYDHSFIKAHYRHTYDVEKIVLQYQSALLGKDV